MAEKTIALTGAEAKIEYGGGCNAWLRNDGAATVYAAKTSGVTAGADGVVAVPAGGSAPLYGADGTVFLLGTGSVQLIGSDYSTNPFKTSTASGGSGVDDVARAAVEAHAGNADIHVTADEKAAWNGKADKSDIPTSLPANGGNADTVGGYGISDAGKAGILAIAPDYGVLEVGNYIDFHSGNDGKDYNVRIQTGGSGDEKLYVSSGNSGFGLGTVVANLQGNASSANYAINADTLGGRSVGDLALKSELTALEARVAALEGGGT